MRQSELFFKTQKEFPKDEVAINAKLLIRANFIEKLMAGVFSFLPLGERVRQKVINIVREEMDKLGAEILMPALQSRALWEKTGRWESWSKAMYQFKDHGGRELGLGPTHEEVVTELAKGIIESYEDLPKAVYQIQTKFRDEPRAKSGLLRGREFTMKDLYSFHADKASLDEYYERVKDGYQKTFERFGLKTYVTEASGGGFSKEPSHEFMVESAAGEDAMILCRLCGFAQNLEITKSKKGDACPKCQSGVLDEVKSIEVGNIFRLGTKFSEALGLNFKDAAGKLHSVIMASYGIGIERLMGTIVEIHHDEKGIIWPEEVAPFKVHLLVLGEQKPELKKAADRVYNRLTEEGLEVLYDDRENVSAGEKLFDADLVGLPWRLVVSDKTAAHEKIEIKARKAKESKLEKLEVLIKTLS